MLRQRTADVFRRGITGGDQVLNSTVGRGGIALGSDEREVHDIRDAGGVVVATGEPLEERIARAVGKPVHKLL